MQLINRSTPGLPGGSLKMLCHFLGLLFILTVVKTQASDGRDPHLPEDVKPIEYQLLLQPFINDGYYQGHVVIELQWKYSVDKIHLHAHKDLRVDIPNIAITKGETKKVNITRMERQTNTSVLVIHLSRPLQCGTEARLYFSFSGKFTKESKSVKKIRYDSCGNEPTYVASFSFGIGGARNVFPCYDELEYKVPVEMLVIRLKNHIALSNTPKFEHSDSCGLPNVSDWVCDRFETTPPVALYSLGVVVFDSNYIAYQQKEVVTEYCFDEVMNGTCHPDNVTVNVWGRPRCQEELSEGLGQFEKALKMMYGVLNMPQLSSKLDVLMLYDDGTGTCRHDVDAKLGLIILRGQFDDPELHVILISVFMQWAPHMISPAALEDGELFEAFMQFFLEPESESKEAIQVNLYDYYKKFGKQDESFVKTYKYLKSQRLSYFIRMLADVFERKTIVKSIRDFWRARSLSTVSSNEMWNRIGRLAYSWNILDRTIIPELKDVVDSWNAIKYIPFVTVTRDYYNSTATIRQKAFLWGKHCSDDDDDVDAALWYIPIAKVTESNITFNATVYEWMPKFREIEIEVEADADQFLIVNPNETGPFIVNYDKDNWRLLTEYLIYSSPQNPLPLKTRIKLLRDAFLLAFAGELDFRTALETTRFLNYEKDALLWTVFGQIIRDIKDKVDETEFSYKFNNYTAAVYLHLLARIENVERNDSQIYEIAEDMLCKLGYPPCVKEKQAKYNLWIGGNTSAIVESKLSGTYCTVFAWGTRDEWKAGLERLGSSSKPNYNILITLARCPRDSWKIKDVLDHSVEMYKLKNFTDTDIRSVLNEVTKTAIGYTALFDYVSSNWYTLKRIFERKTGLWNALIEAATGNFKTENGLKKINALYEKHGGEFGSADDVIQKSLADAKAEIEWGARNLADIEAFLDDFLKDGGGIV